MMSSDLRFRKIRCSVAFSSLILLLVMSVMPVHAQTGDVRTVSGYVRDAANNQGLVGATVMLKGTTVGTMIIADDGSFSLSYDASESPAAVLLASCLGHSKSEISLGGG